jgi:hypothetical protein
MRCVHLLLSVFITVVVVVIKLASHNIVSVCHLHYNPGVSTVFLVLLQRYLTTKEKGVEVQVYQHLVPFTLKEQQLTVIC